MAFTRDNLGQTQSFTRDGASTFQSTPNFQLFNTTQGAATFSLNNSWTIKSFRGTNPSITFNYNDNIMLEITSQGVGTIVQPSLKLSNNSGFPAFANYYNGDLVKVQGTLYMLVEGSNNPN